MTNNLSGGKLSIMKCSGCQDGYLIVKSSKNGGCFLGCSNYKTNHTGCNSMLSMREYYKNMGYEYPDKAVMEISNGMQVQRQSRSVRQDVCSQQAADRVPEKVPSGRQVEKDGMSFDRPSDSSLNRRENWEQEILERAGECIGEAGHFPEYKNRSVFVMVETVLQALVHISDRYYFGISILADVLRGLRTDKIKKYHLDAVAEYGSMKYLTRREMTAVIGWLIERNYILQTKGRYPVLHITNRGLTYKEHLTPRNTKSLLERLVQSGGNRDAVL